MPINLPGAFNVGASVPIDTRIVLTPAQMLATNDNVMPDTYFALCSVEGYNGFYLYNKNINNENLDPVTGKYTKIFDSAILPISTAEIQALFE